MNDGPNTDAAAPGVAGEVAAPARAEERYRALFEHMAEGLFLAEILLDGAGNPADFRYLDVNAAYARLTGLARATTVGRTARELFPTLEPVWLETFGRVAATGEPARIEQYAASLGRHYSAVAYSPHPGQVACLFQDVSERKRAEAEVHRSREAYRHLVEGSGSVILRADRDLRIRYMNPFGLQFFGYAPEEILGKPALGTIIPERDAEGRDLAAMVADLARHPGHYRTHVHQNRRKDGSLVWMSWANQPVYDDRGTVVELLVIGHDVSRLREAEEALRRAEEEHGVALENEKQRLEAVMEALPVGVAITDAAGGNVKSNRAFDALWGQTGPGSPGAEDPEAYRAWWSATGRRLQPQEWAAAQAVQKGETVVGQLLEIERGDGTHRFVINGAAPIRDAAGAVVGSAVSLEDVTELESSKRRFRSVLDGSRDVIYRLNAQTLRYEYISPSADAVLGYPAAELMALDARTAFSKIHPDDAARVAEAIARLPEEGRLEIEYRQRTKSGEYRWMSNHMHLVRDREGRPLFRDGNIRDVTGRKRAEEALREADRRKTEFLAVLSHELRNPLTPIVNCLHLLERAAPGGDQARRAQAVIRRQVDQLVHLVDDLLDLTRISRNKIDLQLDRVELGELVRTAVEDHRTLFERAGLAVQGPPRSAPVSVSGDRIRLSQVVGNLLQNAARFTPRGGRVCVSVAADRASKSAEIRVADSGVGLAPEMLERLFQPFAQAEKSLARDQGGLGLGLALVKGLVTLHGGEVHATSRGLGEGAEFVVRLPACEDVTAPASVAEGPGGALRRRVLVIEDNADAAESLRELLELDRHEVEVASTGAEGLGAARRFRPEIVLCDIGLPGGMDGYDVARALRADDAARGALLVALSGYALPEDVQRAREAGFDRHLAKPPDLDAIEALLREPARRTQERRPQMLDSPAQTR